MREETVSSVVSSDCGGLSLSFGLAPFSIISSDNNLDRVGGVRMTGEYSPPIDCSVLEAADVVNGESNSFLTTSSSLQSEVGEVITPPSHEL